MSEVDWTRFELESLAEELRETRPGPEAERLVWAFERALVAARVDEELLDCLLAACTCLLAASSGRSPRDVLEQYFRLAVPDDVWRERYLPLFA